MSKPSPDFRIWDLVKVPFPYTNRPIQQRRPALVVALPDAPETLKLLWVLMVTSAANRGWPGDVLIVDHGTAGLPSPSVVRSAKLATIEAQNAEKVGRLHVDEQVQITRILRSCFEARHQD